MKWVQDIKSPGGETCQQRSRVGRALWGACVEQHELNFILGEHWKGMKLALSLSSSVILWIIHLFHQKHQNILIFFLYHKGRASIHYIGASLDKMCRELNKYLTNIWEEVAVPTKIPIISFQSKLYQRIIIKSVLI